MFDNKQIIFTCHFYLGEFNTVDPQRNNGGSSSTISPGLKLAGAQSIKG